MRNVDAAEGVLEIGGPHADGIDSQGDAGPAAQRFRDQRQGAGDFAQPGDENHLRRERHPIRRDLEKRARHRKMRHAARDEERREDPAHDGAGGGKGDSGGSDFHAASVARIERQRNPGLSARLVPDFVSLNPGYACWSTRPYLRPTSAKANAPLMLSLKNLPFEPASKS